METSRLEPYVPNWIPNTSCTIFDFLPLALILIIILLLALVFYLAVRNRVTTKKRKKSDKTVADFIRSEQYIKAKLAVLKDQQEASLLRAAKAKSLEESQEAESMKLLEKKPRRPSVEKGRTAAEEEDCIKAANTGARPKTRTIEIPAHARARKVTTDPEAANTTSAIVHCMSNDNYKD